MAKEIILPFSELKATLNDTPIEPTLEITENGVYNVKGYVYADVNVEGGGGESDFSTAEVTINIQGNVHYNVIAIVNDAIKDTFAEGSETYTVPLYKGSLILSLPPGNLSEPPAFTGDVALSIPDGGIKVTGNGSITLIGAVS